MTQQRLVKAIFALLIALILLSPGMGTAQDAPHITQLSPGDGSQVVSPIPVSVEVLPVPGGLVRLELLNSQGQALSRQLLRLDTDPSKTLQAFTTNLPFEIPGDEQTALLTLSLLDIYNRPVALRSAQITLRAGGEASIQPHQEDVPWVTLSEPQPLDSVSGGALTVVGTVTPFTESPIFLVLLDETGRAIGSRQLLVVRPGLPFDFETTLVYTYIQTFTDARLVVLQKHNTFDATAILDSIAIGVAP